MNRARLCRNGVVVTPHHLASEAGLAVLREGGDAIEAAVAAAAAIAVVYPHMNGLGGDGFWLIDIPGLDPIAIDAAGPAARAATPAFYAAAGCEAIPVRGPLAALTTPGAVDGWRQALEISRSRGGRLPNSRLLEEAQALARDGFPVTASQVANTRAKLDELASVPGFGAFLSRGEPPSVGEVQRHARLADTLDQLGRAGLEDFYRGDVAAAIAADLATTDSPLDAADLAAYRAEPVAPLRLDLAPGRFYNHGAPTQGVVSLLILSLFETLGGARASPGQQVHLLIEATKAAFRMRDAYVADRRRVGSLQRLLAPEAVAGLAAQISPDRAADWDAAAAPGDTVWIGATDRNGVGVSYIQSIFWEFGSGVVLPSTGVTLQNRGAAFSLGEGDVNVLAPGAKPFHTLNPALARLNDGRRVVYGAMGGEGQPQTQAALITRYLWQGQDLQAAVTAPRWLLGRTWGSAERSLRVERNLDPEILALLAERGHAPIDVEPLAELMGHAGAIARRPDGVLEAAFDPRSDGSAAGF